MNSEKELFFVILSLGINIFILNYSLSEKIIELNNFFLKKNFNHNFFIVIQTPATVSPDQILNFQFVFENLEFGKNQRVLKNVIFLNPYDSSIIFNIREQFK
jgi:hypothetical protein